MTEQQCFSGALSRLAGRVLHALTLKVTHSGVLQGFVTKDASSSIINHQLSVFVFDAFASLGLLSAGGTGYTIFGVCVCVERRANDHPRGPAEKAQIAGAKGTRGVWNRIKGKLS